MAGVRFPDGKSFGIVSFEKKNSWISNKLRNSLILSVIIRHRKGRKVVYSAVLRSRSLTRRGFESRPFQSAMLIMLLNLF
jgi:hypothetical protein